jgi:hypothetical protein
MGETEKKCFIEEIPDETMITGKYRTQLYDDSTNDYMPASPGIGMHVEVLDPEKKSHPIKILCIRRALHIYLTYSWRTSYLFTYKLK